MALEGLSEYAERSSKLIEDSPQMDEENTKRKLIEPLTTLLGWDILSTDVELEYSVQMGRGTKKVDYALKINDVPVVFIEAKGADTVLNEDHENQLKSYMRQVGVDWGLLSNGRQFKIYRRDSSSSRPNEILLADFALTDIESNVQPLTALARDSITTGQDTIIAENIRSTQRAIQTLRENKETIAEDITQRVTTDIGESVSQYVEDEAKAFVDSLIEKLELQGRPIETSKEPVQTDSGSSAMSVIDSSSYIIALSRNGNNSISVSGETQSEVFAALVEYLVEEEQLLEAIDLPYVPGTGRGTRALLNTEPVHLDGDEMRLYEELTQGYYLYTSLNAKSKIRYASELCELVELQCEFKGAW
ncbi:type I restriction enzyme HsdR N-terminal domain-containing protein [Halorubrum vacuolatum]|uniref:Type I restriction enzyme R protein N-terminal domain-containing protein n=1 Tax=Halorubrum vacuolatum TaxID=63740 RepID=A0A238X872_HALVU|nr:type I restriction enzyme HsdR N-terminal domain-containing protein [Halorubrum vacuolatum]SNR54822.1 hypothetical protein SAMN06264855_11452 [Halorubrum vacuolatum]